MAAVAFALIFEVPYSRYISSNFSDVSTFLFASFFTVLPKSLTARSYVHVALYQGVTNLWVVAHTWPVFFPPHPWNRWSLTSTVTPTPLLYSFFSFSPKSMTSYSEGNTTNLNLRADPKGCAVYSLGLRQFACWDCGFESRGCLSLVCAVCCQG